MWSASLKTQRRLVNCAEARVTILVNSAWENKKVAEFQFSHNKQFLHSFRRIGQNFCRCLTSGWGLGFPARTVQSQYKPSLRFRLLKGTVPRDFRLLVFFMNQFPPSTWVYRYGHFEFFRKFAKILRLKVHHWRRWHRWQIEKIFHQKNVNYFVWTPWVLELTWI